ncbi:carbohydrate ABC transporter permease [Haploplasma axanthum]|uniref:Maltose transport system permease protein malF n=1 Tax=Haploplasma axanthum TaxID=29552 RepID=A0A449BFC3_HAPAX|nr:sugar ABC transporter permease [Haploplasma axanthum]VEU81128.1 Maltose transport system permease protein malF [Haploplasma axanthum]
MKTKSYLKAIASGFIWGLGQLFNKQFIKALFFFVIFASFITIELATSKYFYKESFDNELAFSKIPGEDFGDSWFERMPFVYYQYLNDAKASEKASFKNENFENFLTEIGVVFAEVNGEMIPLNGTEKNFTEKEAIRFFAEEFKRTSFKKYTNLTTNEVIHSEDFNLDGFNYLRTNEVLYLDSLTNKFYVEKQIVTDEGVNEKEYVETNLLTDKKIENPSVLKDNKDLITIEKKNDFYKGSDNNYYLRVIEKVVEDGKIEQNTKYLLLNQNDNLIYSSPENTLTKVTVLGPMYINDKTIYEYYEPALVHNGYRMQYNDSTIMKTFKKMMQSTFLVPGNQYTSTDFERLMLMISFEINPEVKEEFIKYYNNFFYDRAGMFVKGYWSVVTLGSAKKQNYTSYMALSNAMIGDANSTDNLNQYINLVESIPIQGHISTMLLIEGLIAVLLSLFFIIFMVWSIKDAYKVSEQKRLQEEVENDRKYFKSVWENGFEYIVLSPAVFVLAFISIMPILFGFLIAFTSIKGNQSMVENFSYVGFENFIALFNFNTGLGASFGKAFWSVLGWTIVWAVLSTFTVFFGGFIQALILNSEKVVFRKLWRTILILPWAIPALLSQMVFSVMFKETGFINQLLMNIGVYDLFTNIGILGKSYSEVSGFVKFFWLGNDNIQWFTNPYNITFVRATLVVVNIWLGFPYFMALMTGIMTAIDKNLYEAADIDGATGLQKLTKITIPLVLYSTAPILIMSFSGNFNNFGVIYFITGGGPNSGLASRGYAGSTDILISWMYKLTVDYSVYNMASVFSVLVFLVVGSVTAWNLSRTRAFKED